MIISLNKASKLFKIICGKRGDKNNYIYTYISKPIPIPISIYKDRDKNICKYFSLLQIKQEMGKMYLGAIKKEIPSPHTKCSREKCETMHPNLSPHPTGMQGTMPCQYIRKAPLLFSLNSLVQRCLSLVQV